MTLIESSYAVLYYKIMDQLAPVRSKIDTFPVSLPLRYFVPSVEGSKLSEFSDDPYPGVDLGKNIWRPGPSSFGRQQRLNEIYVM